MKRDEHEMMIDYAEMTAFNFNSEEFEEVKRDFIECRSMVSNFNRNAKKMVRKFKPAKGY